MAALRPPLAVLAALVAALALAACGGDDEDDGEQAAPPAATETQPETGTQPAEDGEEAEDGADEASVEMTEFAFEPTELTLTRGATIEARNDGQVQHNLTLEQPGTGRRIAGTPTIGAGEQATVEVDLEPGRYLMVCTVPGHREAGMLGELTVVR